MFVWVCVNVEKLFIINVKFVKMFIIEIEFLFDFMDCIISNCVINFVFYDDKYFVFKEIYCLFKVGGWVLVSDFLVKK